MDQFFEEIQHDIIKKLTKELSPNLYYHSVEHTKYVLKMAEYLGTKEKVSEHDLYLIKIAALFHDSGFLRARENHEELSCEIVRADLEKYSFSEEDLDTICGMIMATKLPQNPKNQLEEILADADLEYISTQNYDRVSQLLFQELKYFNPNFAEENWLDLQISFLESHRFHTEFCRKNKDNFKQQHLYKLKKQKEALS